tara:strand:+ start:42 stop:425 length:384 start_codon:yes stop_codon:yes gene_type:complete
LVDSEIPLITLVIKSQNSDGLDLLSDRENSLLDTLSMLCSFLSVKDFCSFIFSDKFSSLTKYDLDLVFEIGLYSNHEITLELSLTNDKMRINDLIGQGCFENNSFEFAVFEEFENGINCWLSSIFNQ